MKAELLAALAETQGDFDKSLAVILRHFNAQVGTIHTIEADGMLHMCAHTPGMPEPILAATRLIPIGKGMAGLAVERKTPVNVCNIEQDKSGDVRPAAKCLGPLGSLCVPMMDGDRAVGALGIASVGERTFTAEEIDALLAAGKSLARYVR